MQFDLDRNFDGGARSRVKLTAMGFCRNDGKGLPFALPAKVNSVGPKLHVQNYATR
jgi:hypothetical protein